MTSAFIGEALTCERALKYRRSAGTGKPLNSAAMAARTGGGSEGLTGSRRRDKDCMTYKFHGAYLCGDLRATEIDVLKSVVNDTLQIFKLTPWVVLVSRERWIYWVKGNNCPERTRRRCIGGVWLRWISLESFRCRTATSSTARELP